MTEEVAKTIDTAQAGEPNVSEPEPKKLRGAFSKVKRELSDADLKKPAVGRLLLSQNDKYEQQIAVLEEYKEKYYFADKRADVLNERLGGVEKSSTGRSLLFTFGGLLAGFLPSLWSNQQFFWPAAIVACALFAIAIFRPFNKK